ncbi:MAG: hypothetical protein ABI543_01245 [Ignavibacteria bacterium]
MKIFLNFSAFCALLFVIASCGSNNKNTQSSLTNIDEEKKFALTLYGDEVKVIASGDLLGNGKQCAIAAIVMKQTDNSYWIRKGSFIQKESDGWKVILKMEDKISTTKGNLVEQVDAKDGYIIRFDTTKKPISINIVMANEYGKGTSDEAEIKWNKITGNFEFASPYNEIPQ